MSDLSSQQCKACEGGVSPLTREEAERYLNKLASEWVLSDDVKSISCTFKFKNYYETMAFVNVAAMVAHQQDHHPDMTISYNTCYIEYSTHSIGGLSENDFICAAKTDKTLKL
jgi:4a-hydroxytetrahydrobiopterin dehydratase